MIKVNQVTKSYSEQSAALNNISFKIDEGRIVYLMGASGSGKSTLLRIIAGLEDLDSGEVLIDGDKIEGPNDKLVPGYDYVAHVDQKFRLQPYLRVSENIARSIPYLNEIEKEEKIRELLSLCNLKDKYDEYPPNLSGGEQQRICIAAHIANDPLVLLLDEPFSNLDLPQKHSLQESLTNIIRSTHTTALVVTHDPEEALSLADEIMVMDQGNILQHDNAERTYLQPKNARVAELLGPINSLIIDGEEMLIRPEEISINDQGAYSGLVESAVFLGREYRLAVRSDISGAPIYIYSSIFISTGTSIKFNVKNMSS